VTAAVWHDLECGAYREDLALWRSLAETYGDPVLDVGAGTGRVALELAAAGHRVTALDADAELLAELARRAAGLPVRTVAADARTFTLDERFPLCLVPMQTIQLLGGHAERLRFLTRARTHLLGGGIIAAAITTTVEYYELADGEPGPLPDVLERDGTVYFSQPTAIRPARDGFLLERRRERIDPHGGRTVEENRIHLDALTAAELEQEGAQAGLAPLPRVEIAATDAHVGSVVVMLGA
jgi:SAM-dependent methyltransferase